MLASEGTEESKDWTMQRNFKSSNYTTTGMRFLPFHNSVFATELFLNPSLYTEHPIWILFAHELNEGTDFRALQPS